MILMTKFVLKNIMTTWMNEESSLNGDKHELIFFISMLKQILL